VARNPAYAGPLAALAARLAALRVQ